MPRFGASMAPERSGENRAIEKSFAPGPRRSPPVVGEGIIGISGHHWSCEGLTCATNVML